MSHFKDMHVYKKSCEVYLAHDNVIGEALKAVTNIQYDDDVYILAHAARIVRHDIKNTQNFQGLFGPNCQNVAVSATLCEIVSMIL